VAVYRELIVDNNIGLTPVLMSLHWLPMEKLIDFKILLYIYKVIHKMAPQYLEEIILVYRPQRSLRSENSLT
jgi:hypothetical protein